MSHATIDSHGQWPSSMIDQHLSTMSESTRKHKLPNKPNMNLLCRWSRIALRPHPLHAFNAWLSQCWKLCQWIGHVCDIFTFFCVLQSHQINILYHMFVCLWACVCLCMYMYIMAWRRSPALLEPFVRGIYQRSVGFSYQGSVMWGFDVLFDVGSNRLLDKHSSGRWFETPWR